MRRYMLIAIPLLVLLPTCRWSSAHAQQSAICGPYSRNAFGSTPSVSSKRIAKNAAHGIDFYTNKPVAQPVDVDHVFSLRESWLITCSWPAAKRRSFSNDQLNLVVTSAHINRAKGNLNPTNWQPASKSRRCPYIQRYAQVAETYALYLTDEHARDIAKLSAAWCAS